MENYSIEKGKLGKHETIILSENTSGTKAEIALRGATLLSYYIPVKGRLINIIDGYQSAVELEELAGARCSIMAPFSNRIEDGFYEFNDEQHQLINPVNSAKAAMHGLTRVADFEIKTEQISDSSASVVLFTPVLRKGKFPGYPFDVDVEVSFSLKSGKLGIIITGKNIGSEPAPFCSGWHPYFKTSENGIDHLELSIPASTLIEIDEKYVPLKGNEAYTSVDEFPECDFRPKKEKGINIIGEREVNVCYTNLSRDLDGMIRSSITDNNLKLTIKIYQDSGVFYAFTGDGLKYRPRKSIALEPVEHITNSYNRPEVREAITLAPGAENSFHFGIEFFTD
jgi:aldose 1-epimerase